MLHYTGIALAAGFLLDLAIGDPRWLYHPVRLIGKLIDRLEKNIRKVFPKTPGGELTGGIFLVIGIVLVTVGVTAGILHGLWTPCSSRLCAGILHVLSDAGSSLFEGRKHACI